MTITEFLVRTKIVAVRHPQIICRLRLRRSGANRRALTLPNNDRAPSVGADLEKPSNPYLLPMRSGASPLPVEGHNSLSAGIPLRLERQADLPDDLVLIPGVIDSTTNYVEHPRNVADRILRFADIVGRERVIVGTDCGFSTFAGYGVVDPEIVFAKLRALAEGAAIASEELF